MALDLVETHFGVFGDLVRDGVTFFDLPGVALARVPLAMVTFAFTIFDLGGVFAGDGVFAGAGVFARVATCFVVVFSETSIDGVAVVVGFAGVFSAGGLACWLAEIFAIAGVRLMMHARAASLGLRRGGSFFVLLKVVLLVGAGAEGFTVLWALLVSLGVATFNVAPTNDFDGVFFACVFAGVFFAGGLACWLAAIFAIAGV